MTPARSGLGRGLSALLPSAGETVQQIDIDLIAPNPDQPRTRMDPASLAELSQSIAEHGILQPLLVTRDTTESGASTYTLIAGERRLRAARLAGLTHVPALIRDAEEVKRLELALVENIQRADLSPLEEAEAFRRLVDDLGLTQEEVGRRVGRGRAAVANAIRLLDLNAPIKASLSSGEISAGHARALLGAGTEADRTRLLAVIRQRSLNVRQTEELVRRLRAAGSAAPKAERQGQRDPERAALEERLRSALETEVEVQPSRRGGRIMIRYYDDDDLQELLAVLLGGRRGARESGSRS